MKIDIFIWSKDRPLQLDACIRSICDNFINCGTVHILYDYSNQNFLEGYNKIIKKNYNLNILFYRQTIDTFKAINEMVMDSIATEFSLGLCDDSLFINKVDCSNIIDKIKLNNDITCASLRLGHNIKKHYVSKGHMNKPSFIEDNDFLLWEWAGAEADWGYPFAVETQIFNHKWYKEFIKDINYNLPTTLESGFCSKSSFFKKLMISYKESKISNICINRIQNYSNNLFDKTRDYNSEKLNNLFLNGLVINNNKIYGNFSEYLFQEIDLEFINE